MIKKRKAQGLSMNVMIMAVLALIVLVVLISVFTQTTGKSVKTLESCFGRGGECRTDTEGCKATESNIFNVKCPEGKPICCIKIFDDT